MLLVEFELFTGDYYRFVGKNNPNKHLAENAHFLRQ
jgi:hypothetical protein